MGPAAGWYHSRRYRGGPEREATVRVLIAALLGAATGAAVAVILSAYEDLESAGSQSAGSQSAGSQSAGSQSAGSQSAGPQGAGP